MQRPVEDALSEMAPRRPQNCPVDEVLYTDLGRPLPRAAQPRLRVGPTHRRLFVFPFSVFIFSTISFLFFTFLNFNFFSEHFSSTIFSQI
jgi:hypothetical protein